MQHKLVKIMLMN